MKITGKVGFDPFDEKFSKYKRILESSGAREERLIEVLAHLPEDPQRMLDAGCGRGDLCLYLADRGRHVVGADISYAMISIMKNSLTERGIKNVDFLVADLECLPFKDKVFDFVVSIAVLHHTRHDVTLPGLRRLIRPRGRMVLIDFVTRHPRLDAWPVIHITRAITQIPKKVKTYGLRAALQLTLFLISPTWVRHVSTDRKFTSESLQSTYSRFLPRCKFKNHDWKMTAFWEAL